MVGQRGHPGSLREVTSTADRWSRVERATAAAIVTVCLLLCAAVSVYLVLSRERVLDRTRAEASALAETISQHAERSFHEVDLSLRAIIEAELADTPPARMTMLLAAYTRRLPQVAQIAVFGPEGATIAASRQDSKVAMADSFGTALRQADDSRTSGLILGLPVNDPRIGSWTMTVARRIEDTDGSYRGAAVALVRFDYFSDFYRSLAFQGPTTVLSLLDGQSRLLVRYPARQELLGLPLPEGRVLDAAIEAGRRLEIPTLAMLDGETRHAYVRQVGQLPVFALVGVDETILLRPWRIEAAAFAVVLVVLVGMTGWIGWLGVRQMARTRRSEAALARQAAWLESVVETIDQGIAVFDGDARLVAWNRNAERLLGIPSGDFEIGRHFSDLVRNNGQRGEFGDADVERMIADRLAAASGPDGEVYDHVRPNGQIIEIARTPMPLGGFVSSYRDVTADRQSSKDLQQRAEILRILHSIAQAANEAPDLASAMRRTLHLIAEGAGWPVAVAHRLVPGPDPILAPAHWYLADRERYEPFRDATSRLRFRQGEGLAGAVLETGKPVTIADLMHDSRFQARSEALAVGLKAAFAVPVLERRRVVGVLVFFSDQRFAEDYFLFAVLDSISAQISRVAERERSEAGLKARELRLRSVFESVVDGLFTINESGSIETMNPAAEQMFEITAETGLRRDIRQLFADGETRFAGTRIIDRMVSQYDRSGGDLQGRRSDGSLFPVEIAAREMRLEDRRLAVLVVRDISERRRIERMKSEFVSTVSHELRTPLTSIAGSLGLLAGGVAGDIPPRARQLIEIARNNSNRLVLLINDILDLEKIEAGRMDFKPREVDIADLARQAIDANRAYAQKYEVAYDLVEPSDACLAHVDPDRIMQVFNNLLSNAAKFSTAGGTVEIVVARADPVRLRVEVVDHGQGIPQAFQARIFEKFSQADSTDSRAKGGTGLGLSIVRTIVERSGGTVGFRSAEGQGTTFWFELPELRAGDDSAAAQCPDPFEAAGEAAGRALCLLGDDDAAASVLRVLATEGFAAEHHADLDGLRRAIEDDRADVIIVDLDKAGPQGVDLLQELRGDAATRDIPVVPISTRRALEGLGGTAVTIGDWLEAPVDERRIADALRAVFDGGSTPARVLHVEDDPDIVEVVRVALRGSALVHAVPSLERARALLREQAFDVILLDLELEDGSGADLIPALSAGHEGTLPVILFSASEPPKDLIEQVAESLLKSKTSLDALRRAVAQIARRGHRKSAQSTKAADART